MRMRSPTPSTTHKSEQFSNEQSFKNTNYELERHLGEHLETVIEVFQERTTLEQEYFQRTPLELMKLHKTF